ncbi:hypothetical protein EV424DRAFT_1407628, partial [Suillus variegatus]
MATLFLAVRVKQIASYCHTFLEIVHVRDFWTGRQSYCLDFLILLGVCIYVILGGLCTTFLCDYSQAPMILSIIATDTKTV